MEYVDPLNPYGHDPYKGLTDQERIEAAIWQVCSFFAVLFAGIIISVVLSGCSAPKAIEYHHHHTYEADTLALQAQMDSHLRECRRMMDSAWSERVQQFFSQQSQSEHQQETITETVTETVDSLGRKIRQEQRTISRDITREQQLLEQRLTREYESRLQQTVAELDSTWQARLDALQTHFTQNDSTAGTETPVAIHQDNRPWYRRWWDHVQWLVIGAVLAAAIWFTRKWWMKVFV